MMATSTQNQSCLYCGNNQTSHRAAWLNNYIELVLIWFDSRVVGTPLYRFFDQLTNLILAGLFNVLKIAGAVRYNADPHKSPSDRGLVLWQEANRRGIPMRSLIVFGKYTDIYEAQIKCEGKVETLRFTGLPRPEPKYGTGLVWMDDKAALKQHLQKAGLPVAAGGAYSKWEDLLAAFNKLAKPVIVKPRLGSRGRHSITFIYTEEHLRQAFDIAKQLCRWVVLEEHLRGAVYRGTVIGGKLVGVLGGDPPRITGNGQDTIRQLIEKKNATKPEGVKDFIPSELTHAFLARSNYNLDTVLPNGLTIDLTEKIGVNYGGTSFEVTDQTHPEIKRVMEAAALVVNDPLVGFDFIIDRVDQDPTGKKWGIIECNSLPFINLHHDPLVGKPQNVAKYVWDLWQPEES